MLTVEIVVALVVVALAAAALTRRRSHDDVHSVEGYHRQLHTLEHMNVHPVEPVADSEPAEGAKEGKPVKAAKPDKAAKVAKAVGAAFPESAVRVPGTRTVRVTDGVPTVKVPEGAPRVVPPVPPPPVPDPEKPVTFDDAGPSSTPSLQGSSLWRQDRAVSAMNRRPRRLAAPAIAVASVIVLIVVLIVTGTHSVKPPHRHGSTNATGGTTTKTTTHTVTTHSGTKGKTKKKTGHPRTTTTTTLPVVSLPRATSVHGATYQVGSSTFTLVLSATTGPCWVDATDATTHATLYTAVMAAGEQKTIAATGPVDVEVGAPTAFASSVNGTAAVLPFGFQTPFTLQFVPAGSPSSSTTSSTSSTTTTTAAATTSTT
jgi:hypothetical protein